MTRTLRNPGTLSDGDLLALLLRPEDQTHCTKLSEQYPSLRDLAGVHPAELAEHGLTGDFPPALFKPTHHNGQPLQVGLFVSLRPLV